MNKKLNNLLIFVSGILSLLKLLECFNNGDFYNGFIALSIIPIMILFRFVNNFFHLKLGDTTETLFFLYIMLAQLLGSSYKLYKYITCYDDVMHYLSGILTAAAAYIVIIKFKIYKKQNFHFNILFVLSFTAFIALGWEVFEFTCDNLFNKDAQKVITSGVSDTMLDMIYAMIGGLTFVTINNVFSNKKDLTTYLGS